jgi:predicted site-specific integrase-resolvase
MPSVSGMTYTDEGKIAATRTVGGQRRFAQSEIDRLLSDSQTEPAA